jgi:hypothetical protein
MPPGVLEGAGVPVQNLIRIWSAEVVLDLTSAPRLGGRLSPTTWGAYKNVKVTFRLSHAR